MRTPLTKIIALLFVVFLTACGGGGGSAGTTSLGSSTITSVVTATTTTVAVPTILLAIVDASDAVVTTNSINSSAALFARVSLKDASGVGVANKLVTFSTDSTVATLAQAASLTDSNGLTRVQITPVSLTAARAASLLASATVNGSALQSSLDYQTSAANVSLTNFTVASSPISALQSSAVTIQGRINGALATSSAVAVTFSASCGSFSPATASTNGAGLASTTYQSAATCSGAVTLTAQATGAPAVVVPITVTAAAPANVVYTSASNPLLVVSSATNGNRQAIITFQTLNSGGTGISGQTLNIYLESAALNAGVTFSVGGVTTTAVQTVTSDGAGFAAVTVSAGSLPTPLIVTAVLASNINIKASSSGISVTSGKPTQNAASLGAVSTSIEGYSHDGIKTDVTMRVADRQGNPIPAGAVVNFVTGFGLLNPGSCTIDATSSCKVTYSSQGTIRGFNNKGRVAILAYMDGEESFTDLNGDNIWQPGEPFFDMGTVFRDDNEDSVSGATEQTYPGGATGGVSCSGNPYSFPSVTNTCDATWSSSIRVRKQIVIVLSTDDAVISLSPVGVRSTGRFNVVVADANGNAMATGSTVTAAVKTTGSACAVSSVAPAIVSNSTLPTTHAIILNGDPSCAGSTVDVTVTSTGSLLATTGSF